MIRKISLLAMLALLPLLAHADWDAWQAKNKIVINAQAAGAVVADVPVVVRLHSGNFDFLGAKPDGSDLRFVAEDGKTELKYQIEKYDSVNELAVIWVKLPKADPAQKTAHIWLYSANEAAPALTDSSATWDASALAVFHFADKKLLNDSTANQITATGEVTVQKAALLGEAAVFAAKPITIPAVKLSAAGFTWSAWVKPTAIPQQSELLNLANLSLKIDENKLTLIAGADAPISGGEVKAATWQHIAVTIAGGKAELFINGVSVANGAVSIADAQADAKVGEAYNGELDELQIAGAARSVDWIKLAASGQGADGKLVVVEAAAEGEGDEEGGEANYIGILVNSLTLDAKIVIGILAVMFAISVWVMWSKFDLVTKTDKDNKKFLARFQKATSADLLQLDKGGNYKNSNLFMLYMAGLREIKKREHDGQLSLSGASMDAIKASIDAELVRETQRQNSGIVLLTIAISGGPFLGLLGTVVGVMITFAAIAAAGDVNVNAIAPGIAAALLATVAGLGVAIPALFGYNYLASRIKNITIAMQIFVDEYVTRTAELYGKE